MKKLFKNIPVLQGKRVILRGLTDAEADDLGALTEAASVYEYLPTFLFEQKYSDPHTVIQRLYDECLNDSLILGIFLGDQFCGLAEMYGYRKPIKKSVWATASWRNTGDRDLLPKRLVSWLTIC